MSRRSKKGGPKPFANMIKEGRTRGRFSQRQLGERVQTAKSPNGVWNTYVGQIEKGEKVPSDEIVLKLAEVLELSTSEVLLAAYRARADSDQARELFDKMEQILMDPVLQGLVAAKRPLDHGILKALGDETIRAALQEESWREMFARSYRGKRRRDVPAVLALVEAMTDKQWTAVMNLLETMDINGSDGSR